MLYVISGFVGMFLGAFGMYFLLSPRRSRFESEKHEFILECARRQESLRKKEHDLSQRHEEITRQAAEHTPYAELKRENSIIKRDLQSMEIQRRRVAFEQDELRSAQEALNERCHAVGVRYLRDSEKWLSGSLTPNNFVAIKRKLQDVIGRCRELGYVLSAEEESAILNDLRSEYERIVRVAFQREEQARIKVRIREEQLLQRELERELKRLEHERTAVQSALNEALSRVKDEHDAQVERLRARLAEAEAKMQRATSQAQLTKAGHVYVISNIGAFGEGVFKIGVTRRLEPAERIRELGDASVPFPFDVHMMISCDDAPRLENALHRAFHRQRVNRINPRKEFFRVDVEAIRRAVEEHHGEVTYVADPEALEFRQSLEASVDDEEFIESVYEKLSDDGVASED